jgi:hypothetical protein
MHRRLDGKRTKENKIDNSATPINYIPNNDGLEDYMLGDGKKGGEGGSALKMMGQ